MNVFSVRRIKRRTYATREKTVDDKDNYGRSENVNMKIHVQMKDDMPSAINETTPCPLDDLLVLNEFEAGQTSKPQSLICYEKRIWHSKYLQVFSMLITSLYVKLQPRWCRSSNLNWQGRPSLKFDCNLRLSCTAVAVIGDFITQGLYRYLISALWPAFITNDRIFPILVRAKQCSERWRWNWTNNNRYERFIIFRV